MSYYTGGYYAGDYYSGGYYSGGIFSFLGRAVKGIAGAAIGFATGGIGGAIRGAGSAVSAADLESVGPRGLTDKELAALHARDTRLKAAGRKLPALPGTPPGMALVPAGGGMAMVGPGGMLMRGYRLNKSTYITRGGGTSRWPVGLQVHPKHTEPVKTRRMNVANPRALRRALRRAYGFAKLARRYITVTRHFKRKGVRRKK